MKKYLCLKSDVYMNLPPTFKHPCPTTEELQSLANRPALEEWEACKLMQGLCPNRKIGKGEVTWLQEYSLSRNSVNVAKKNEIIKFPITPKNLVYWCAQNEIHLPEGFSNEVNNLIFHLERPDNKVTDTNELIRGSTSDALAKQYPENNKRPGRPVIKKDASVRGYESKVCLEVREFCLSFIGDKGHMPLKKTINAFLSKKLNRTECDINRAYSLKMILTPQESNRQVRVYRKNLQDFIEDAQKI